MNYNGLTEAELGYMAGIIDGEGTLSIQFTRRSKKEGRTRRLRPYLEISNTNQNLIIWLREKIGIGQVMERKRIKPHHKTPYILKIHSKERLKELLLTLKPYLIVKIQQANKIIEFAELDSHDSKNKQRIKDEINNINRKGDKGCISSWS